MLYRIDRITSRTGAELTDKRYQKRIGREGHLMPLASGEPMILIYAEPDVGTLVTSPVCWCQQLSDNTISVKTRNAVYQLRQLGTAASEYPTPIDRE